jgi:pyridoxamine 5'-phosphate oxidase
MIGSLRREFHPSVESSMKTPADMRIDYRKGDLIESQVSPDPIAQFARWFDDAVAAKIPEPNAMTVATASRDGAPSARVILLKAFDARGFDFFTNYTSRKGRELAGNRRAALVFYWHALERQVRIEGFVENIARPETEVYFHSRPRESQIGAWASQQSEVVASRAVLDQRQAELNAKFGSGEIPVPPYWGGYRVVPASIEFWQGRPGRMHDRLIYKRQEDGTWRLQRLEP